MPLPSPMSSIVFFGTSDFAVTVFETLYLKGVQPLFLVTTPDKPQGRHLVMTPPPAKRWAQEKNITVLQPTSLRTPSFADELKTRMPQAGYDVFIVASYGKLIPNEIITLPRRGTLNIHPSLLPKYRGASPVQSTILADDRNCGFSIMAIDEEMDHGPLVLQKAYTPSAWPLSAQILKTELAHEGASNLYEILPHWISGEIEAREQDHSKATFTKKFTKDDGLIDLSGDPYTNYLRFQALSASPGVFFFDTRNGNRIRIKIIHASFIDGAFVPLRVIPEGKKEMDYTAYLHGKKA
jgi:methionyl-tRNA formyltransferase